MLPKKPALYHRVQTNTRRKEKMGSSLINYKTKPNQVITSHAPAVVEKILKPSTSHNNSLLLDLRPQASILPLQPAILPLQPRHLVLSLFDLPLQLADAVAAADGFQDPAELVVEARV